MRFSCHLIAGGQFYWAGAEVPPEVVVTGGAMKYVVMGVPDENHRDVPCSCAVPNENTPEVTSHPYLFSS
jgi:hypothetical protein